MSRAKTMPFVGLLLAPVLAVTGCSDPAVAPEKNAAPAVKVSVAAKDKFANTDDVRIVYGDGLPDFNPRSDDFTEVVIRGGASSEALHAIRILEVRVSETLIQYRIYNAGDTAVFLFCESKAFDPQGILSYSELRRSPQHLKAKQSEYATIVFRADDHAKINLTITVR